MASPRAQPAKRQRRGMLPSAQHAQQRSNFNEQHDELQELSSIATSAQHGKAQQPGLNASPAQHSLPTEGVQSSTAYHSIAQHSSRQQHAARPAAQANLLNRIADHNQLAEHDMQQQASQHVTDGMPQLKLETKSTGFNPVPSQPHRGTHMGAHMAPRKQPMMKLHAFGGKPTWVRQGK